MDLKVLSGRTCEGKTQPAFTYSKLTIETLEQAVKYVQLRLSGIFIVNVAHISHFVLVFLLLTLNMQLPARKRLKSKLPQN